MSIKDLSTKEIINNEAINSKFISVYNDELQVNCKILKNNFYLDSFNYFPITDNLHTFSTFFSWGENVKNINFFSSNFLKNFKKKQNKFKQFSNIFVLGSSVSDNYFRNMITFLPRIFFINEKKINLAIHRNSSNKYRNFIYQILNRLNIKVEKTIYLDDDFYLFKNSFIPQFFDFSQSISILKKSLSIKKESNRLKIFLSRQNSSSRNLINEGDLVENLKSRGFQIIDPNNMEISEQIKYFSSADVIIGPTGSALTNLIFSKEGTKVIEIIPKYQFEYEQTLKNRFSNICQQLNLDYNSIVADPVKIRKNNIVNSKFISKKILEESHYYNDLLIEKNNFESLIQHF